MLDFFTRECGFLIAVLMFRVQDEKLLFINFFIDSMVAKNALSVHLFVFCLFVSNA